MGELIPFYLQEVVPGDKFKVSTEQLIRLAPMLAPIMHRVNVYQHFFFVPNRLVFAKWGDYITGGADGSLEPTLPMMQISETTKAAWYPGLLGDYFGINPVPVNSVQIQKPININALPFRAYSLIWNEYFRDQNLQDSVVVDLDDGPDAIADYVLLKRGKRHDYFTSALPWVQKNNTGTAVSVGLVGNAPVTGIGKVNTTFPDTNAQAYETGKTSPTTFPKSVMSSGTSSSADGDFRWLGTNSPGYPAIYADLSQASGITINSLRLAFQTQRMFERDARSGTRLQEVILAHYGVRGDDARLQRPEYLGGGTSPIMLTPVPQTSVTSGANATGRLAAAGIHQQSGQGFVKSFTEHGIILGMVCVHADLNYQQGLHKRYSRSTRLDMYWPALANLGEDSIKNKEIFLQGSADAAADALPFGYQERWAEYRYGVSSITGKMRSTYSTPLDYWHLAQKFTTLPTLGSTFISEAPPLDRVVAVSTEPQLFFDAYFNLKCARPMPTYSVPGLIDHF